MIKETADKDPLVFIFTIHILSLKLTYQKVRKLMTSLDNLETTFFSPYNGNNYYISMNL